MKLPLIINFRSNRESVSPYLGQGWMLPLLESNIIQTGENEFLMVEPDGLNRSFGRVKAKSSELNGQGGWKAEINGEVITAWADCGWRLVYSKGKIISIGTPKGRNLDFVYSGKKVTEIREKGATKLTVEFDPVNGNARSLSFNGRQVTIDRAEKPRVEAVAGQNVIAGMDSSLHALSSQGVELTEFQFSVNEKIQPQIKIIGANGRTRTMVWDPATKRVIADGAWIYNITPGEHSWDNAAIGRANPSGRSEYWFVDGSRGQEIVQGSDGVRTVTTRFITGVFAGKVRKIEQLKDGKTQIVATNNYDENGRLIKEFKDGVTRTFDLDQFGRRTRQWENGRLVSATEYDGNGRVKSVEYENNVKRTYDYLAGGVTRETLSVHGVAMAVEERRDKTREDSVNETNAALVQSIGNLSSTKYLDRLAATREKLLGQ
ncbi:MAG: hypothetical protein WDN28_24855 [Chthoniobacter sp.]